MWTQTGAKGPKRKSTSGGMMMINGTVVKDWSRTQATRAQVRVWTDCNAAKAIASRRGLGKTRHVELKYLVVAGGNQVRESEDEASRRGAEFVRPSDEGEAVARDRRIDPRSWRIHENESGQ